MFVIVGRLIANYSVYSPAVALVRIEMMLDGSGDLIFGELFRSEHFEMAKLILFCNFSSVEIL